MTTRNEIAEWFKLGLNGGWGGEAPGTFSHMIVMTDEFDYSDYPQFVRAGDDPAMVQPGSMQKIMECYDLRLPMESQLDERRAFHTNVACGLSDWSGEWIDAVSEGNPAPPPRPVVMETDPEIEALLREEAEIEATYAITPMMGEGWYRTYDKKPAEPSGPWESMVDLAEGLHLAFYPKDGYIVYARLMSEGGKFWMEVDAMDESNIDPEDFLSRPTWQNTMKVNGCSVSLQSLIGAAKMLGYDYFVWNGRVYATSSGDIIATVCLEDEVI